MIFRFFISSRKSATST